MPSPIIQQYFDDTSIDKQYRMQAFNDLHSNKVDEATLEKSIASAYPNKYSSSVGGYAASTLGKAFGVTPESSIGKTISRASETVGKMAAPRMQEQPTQPQVPQVDKPGFFGGLVGKAKEQMGMTPEGEARDQESDKARSQMLDELQGVNTREERRAILDKYGAGLSAPMNAIGGVAKAAVSPAVTLKNLVEASPDVGKLIYIGLRILSGDATPEEIAQVPELVKKANVNLEEGMQSVETVGRIGAANNPLLQGFMGATKEFATSLGQGKGVGESLGRATTSGAEDVAMTYAFNKLFGTPKVNKPSTTRAKMAGLTDADVQAATKGSVPPEKGIAIIDAAVEGKGIHGGTGAFEKVADDSFLPTLGKLEAKEASIGKRIGEVVQKMRGKAVPQVDVAPVRDQLEQDLRTLGVKFKGGRPVLTGSKIEGLGVDKLIDESWDFASPKPLTAAAAGKAEIRTQLAADLKRLGVKFKGGEPIFEKPSYGDINGKISSSQLQKQWKALPKPEGGTFKNMFDVYNKVGNLREKIFKGKANMELGQAERALANFRTGLRDLIVNMKGEYGQLAQGYAELDDFLTEISKATGDQVKNREFLRKLMSNASSMSKDQLERMSALAKKYGIEEGQNIMNEARLAQAAEDAAKFTPAGGLQGQVARGVPTSKTGAIGRGIGMAGDWVLGKTVGTPVQNLKRLLEMPTEQITPSRIESLLSNADPELKRGLMKYLNVKSAEQTALDRTPVSSVPKVKSSIPKELKPLTEKTSFNAGETPSN